MPSEADEKLSLKESIGEELRGLWKIDLGLDSKNHNRERVKYPEVELITISAV